MSYFSNIKTKRLPIIPLKHKWRSALVALVVFSVLFLGSGLIGLQSAIPLAQSFPDQIVPFVDWTIWIYVSHYVFIPFVYWVVKKEKLYSAMLYTMLLATLFASIIFVTYPTLMFRLPLQGEDPEDLARQLLYLVDLPTNCFPSLHVALAIIGAWIVFLENRTIGIACAFWAVLIIISTMTIKQHYFADVMGGSVLAFVSYWFVQRMMRKSTSI